MRARSFLWPVSKVELSEKEQRKLDEEREAFLDKAHWAGVPIFPRLSWRLRWRRPL